MSDILQQWREGNGLPDVLVIDGHTHIGEWPSGPNFLGAEAAATGAVELMDACGVDAACVLSGGYMSNGGDYRMGNDILIDCVRRVPDRLIPFGHINPRDNLPSIMAELDRLYDAGVRCIKLLNSYQNYPGDGPNLMALYGFAQDHNMLVLNHAWSYEELQLITAEFPKVRFIRAHGGASRISYQWANVYDNIWSLHTLGTIEGGVQEFGPEKILLGSDAFMNDVPVGIGMVVYADIPDEHKRKILGINMARLLDDVGALPARLQCWLK